MDIGPRSTRREWTSPKGGRYARHTRKINGVVYLLQTYTNRGRTDWQRRADRRLADAGDRWDETMSAAADRADQAGRSVSKTGWSLTKPLLAVLAVVALVALLLTVL